MSYQTCHVCNVTLFSLSVYGLKSVMLAIRTMESKVQALGNGLERLKKFPCTKFYNSLNKVQKQNAWVICNL